MKQPFLDAIASFVRILGQCFQSIMSDVKINCNAPNVSLLILSSISHKVEHLVECMRVVQRLFKSLKPFKRYENPKTNSVENDQSAWADDTMDDRQIAISYIDILLRSNCNTLMVLLNSYWAHSAFEIGPLDYPRILEGTERIRTNAASILKVCHAQPRVISEQHGNQKRSHQYDQDPNIKRRKKSISNE